jgi:hypothetical protein
MTMKPLINDPDRFLLLITFSFKSFSAVMISMS